MWNAGKRKPHVLPEPVFATYPKWRGFARAASRATTAKNRERVGEQAKRVNAECAPTEMISRPDIEMGHD